MLLAAATTVFLPRFLQGAPGAGGNLPGLLILFSPGPVAETENTLPAAKGSFECWIPLF